MLNIILANEKSLFEELWEYFKDTYFTPDMPHFENIQFGNGTMLSLQMIIIGVCLGLIVASACTLYNKRYLGGFVRKMLREECLDPKRAKTLEELGYEKSFGVKRAVRSFGTLSRWARCVEEDEFYAELKKKQLEFDEAHKNDSKKPKFKEIEFKRDVNAMHFYIPEEKKYAADIKFDKKGANIGSFVMVVIVSVALCVIMTFALPEILQMVDNFLSVIK